jgi:hypothetical protein
MAAYIADRNAAGLSSGVYFFNLFANGRVRLRKMMLAK